MTSGTTTQMCFSIDNFHYYDTCRVWELTNALPSEDIPVNDLISQLDTPRWSRQKGDRYGSVSARNVLDNPSAYPDHAARIDAADLGFPILLVPLQPTPSQKLLARTLRTACTATPRPSETKQQPFEPNILICPCYLRRYFWWTNKSHGHFLHQKKQRACRSLHIQNVLSEFKTA